MENELNTESGAQFPQKCFFPSIERLRIILMFFMCINLFGFPTAYGELARTICGFVPISFFILSGYLVLFEEGNRSARIVRAIKRTFIVFVLLLIAYFIINFIYYKINDINIFYAFLSKRVWFNFVVLNVWPFQIGSAIWYVQALLYAYIIIFFMEKWKMLKLDWLIAILLILFTVFTGELAGIFKWNIAGYTYLPGNFLTRALPYVLLGSFIHRKIFTLANIPRLLFWVGIVIGIFIVVAEIVLLGYFGVTGYYGHLIGMGIIAFCACMLAFQDDLPLAGFEFFFGMSRWHINFVYYLCQPVSAVLAYVLTRFGTSVVNKGIGFIGIATFIVCFGLLWGIAYIGNRKNG